MSTEQNKALVRRFMDMVNTHRGMMTLDQFLAPDFVEHNPNLPPGLAGIGQYFAMLRTAFADSTFTLDNLEADGDMVTTHLTFSGTHRGDIWGFPASGKLVTINTTATWRVVDGKLAEHWGGVDSQRLAEQLGVSTASVD